MEIIHADENLDEIQMLTEFDQYEAVSGLGFKYADNDFELQVKEAVWSKYPMVKGHYLYEVGTEWGGMLEDVNHVGTTVKVGGPTGGACWPENHSLLPGQAYRTITAMEANQAISALVGSSLGSLFTVSTANSGITVSGLPVHKPIGGHSIPCYSNTERLGNCFRWHAGRAVSCIFRRLHRKQSCRRTIMRR